MAAIASDAKHSVLGKARPLQQSALSAFLEHKAGAPGVGRLPPAEYGATEVREVEVKSALTRCAMPGEPWSLNPYVGCSHDCAYCYVPDVSHVERVNWGRYVVVKRNLPTLLAHELKRKERRPVFLSSATDPYQPVERHQLVTRRCLELLAHARWPVSVLTRSPLIRRDVDLLSQLKDVQVGLTVPTMDDAMRRIVEPGAPPIDGRLRALRDLADAGLPTYANLAPAYPLSERNRPRHIAEAFAEARVPVVYASAWRYLATVAPVLAERLPEDERETFHRAVHDPRYWERCWRQLRGAFRDVGVRFVVMGMAPGPRA